VSLADKIVMRPVAALEEWRDIPGHEGYQASTLGQIRSVDREVETVEGRIRRYRGRLLRPRIHRRYGCLAVQLGRGSAERWRYLSVSKAVALTFLGEAPTPYHVATRLDGDSFQFDNIVWATRAEITEMIQDRLEGRSGLRYANQYTRRALPALVAPPPAG
jgi:hypothetical protein